VQVVGVPDEKYGEEVYAYVIVKEGETMTTDELRDYMIKNIARHKVPRYIDLVKSFPMNAAGKILKYKMREEAEEKIKNSGLFQISNFWKEYLEYSIDKEIIRSIKHYTQNVTLIKDSQKESDELYGNIVFSQLVPISDNMIDFGLDRKKIKAILNKIFIYIYL